MPMSKMIVPSFVLLIAALSLANCSSPQSKKPNEPNQEHKAAETNTALGRQYMDRREYEVALEKLKRAVAYDKTYAPAHTLLGVLYETLGQQDMAVKEYRLAVHYDPTDGDVNNNYAVYLCGANKNEEADHYFQTAMKDPFYSTPKVVYANAGLCALGANDLDKAERYLRQSLEYDAEFAPALLPMADLNYRNGAYLNARAFLQRYEATGASDAQSLLLGYRIEGALGNSAGAGHYKSDLISKFPNSAEAVKAREQN